MTFIKTIHYSRIIGINIRGYSHIKLVKKRFANMDIAYFRHEEGQENYEFTFLLSNTSLGINRQFNFTRRTTETVGSLIDRIVTNVDKFAQKKKKKKTKNEEVNQEASQPLDVKLLQNGEVISKDKPCLKVMKAEHQTQLHIMNSIFNIVVNAPWITALHLPTSILAGFPVYPAKFDGQFVSKKYCKFQWYSGVVGEKTNINSITWTEVGEGFTYFSTTADIGKHLKIVCIPGNGNIVGPEVESVSVNNVEAGPGFCPFDNRHVFTKETTSGDVFRMMSYNILADLYCDSDFTRTMLYPYCPAYALHIDYRKQLILKEILGYNADVICLQEVDSKVFDMDLEPLLQELGFEGIFSKKGGQVAEGLACFYNTTRFQFVESHTLPLSEEIKTSPVFQEIWRMISHNEAFVTRLTERTTVAQATVLQSVDRDNEIVVIGNTHLYFHPDADHVRLIQGGMVITWLNNIISQLQNQMSSKRISLILCGDFNSVPSCGIYQLYTTGVVTSDLVDWKSNETEALSDVCIRQSRILSSACGTPEFTNYTVGFADCLDYIFHDTNIKTVQIIPFPSLDELKENTALPSIVFPSDHVALVSDLQFC